MRDRPGAPDDREPDRSDAARRLRPTPGGVVTAWALAGLVGGWLLRRLLSAAGVTAPVVSWAQPVGVALLAAALGATAWATWRSTHVHDDLIEPHVAVNRLVLARAGALVGALVAGGYAGHALSWVGVRAELADDRIVRSLVAAVAGAAVVAASLLLERACRVPPTEPDA